MPDINNLLSLMKIISASHIRSLDISSQQCINWVCQSLSVKSLAQLPKKVNVCPQGIDFFTSMPCLLPDGVEGLTRRYFGIKEVHRLEGAVPALGSDLLLYDARSGELLALIDADWITAMRTGALTALASKVLRKSNAEVYGMVGLGNVARASLICILEQERERRFKVCLLRYKDQAQLFIDRFKDYDNVDFEVVDDINLLASSSDVFISCITATDGLLVDSESRFRNGATVIPVHTRGFQNLDCVFDRVFGDDTGHVSGFRFFNQFRYYNEIGEVLAGRDKGRCSDSERILSYNYGLGLHDVIFAAHIYELLEGTSAVSDIARQRETRKFWI